MGCSDAYRLQSDSPYHVPFQDQWYQCNNRNSIKKLEVFPNLELVEVLVGENWEDRTLCSNEALGKCLEHLGEGIEMGLSRAPLYNVFLIPLPQ